MSPPTQPRVTIVMTARERYGLTVDAIDGILRHTPGPYRLIYADAQAPDWLRQALAPYQARGELEVLRSDESIWPHVARRNVMREVASEYVVFIDNDVLVAPGWLEAMVRCADETGAAIVGPLYLWGGGATPVRVHMAGGQLTRHEAEGGCVLEEAHLLANADPGVVAPNLKRQRCDYVEFHCMLVRTALLDGGALLDPDIHCVHEHIDLSLALEARGGTWLEPAAVVNYQAFAPLAFSDLPLYRARWSVAAAERSIAAFCAKWGVLDDERSFGAVRDFVRGHVAQLDPMRPSHPPQPDSDRPMRAEELCQTPSALLDLAAARGYGEQEIVQFVHAYGLAQVLMDGGYRPCGRPFINHLAGTASVMIRYGFRHELVVAAMLHAFYTHCPPHRAGVETAFATVRGLLGGPDSPIERRVRAYTRRDTANGSSVVPRSLADLSVLDAEVLMLVVANEIDMHLSGELRYSGRPDTLAPAWMPPIADACRLLGVPGMVETLALARANVAPAKAVTHRSESYRIGPDRRSAVSMLSAVPTLLRDS